MLDFCYVVFMTGLIILGLSVVIGNSLKIYKINFIGVPGGLILIILSILLKFIGFC